MARKMFNEFILCKGTQEEKTNSGFQTEVDKGFKSLVVAISQNENIVVGDVVLIKGTSGNSLNLNEEEYTVIHITDVIMTL